MLFKLFQKAATVCGHSLARKGVIKVGDKEVEVKRPKNAPTHCYECESDRSIVCGLCEEIIIAGSLIGIYTPSNSEYTPPIRSYVVSEADRSVIVCSGYKNACAGMGFACGHWNGEGYTPLDFD